MGIHEGIKMKKFLFILLSFLIFFSAIASAEYTIYDNITIGQYKSITIKDVTNIKYVNSYAYDVYLNDSFYGTYQKNELILIPDNVSIRILPTNEVKNSLSASTFTSMIGAGFYAFMQYGVYIIIAFFILMWILKRRR